MKLILAQGNPGTAYARSRHNVGWQILDALALEQGINWQTKPKFLTEMAEFSHHDQKIWLLKPQTFYNETGRSARAVADFYRVDTSDILVIHDDLALPFGTLRIRQGGSDAGNNGIKSLSTHLPQQFWRLRVGISDPTRRQHSDADFVLGNFSAQQQQQLTDHIIPAALRVIHSFAAGRLQPTSLSCLPAPTT